MATTEAVRVQPASSTSRETPLLELLGVSAAYGDLMVLKKVDLLVRAGDLVCIIGPNGAGKTTLLKLVNGLLKPSGGEIRFRGQRIDGCRAYKVARCGITQMFQDIQLCPTITVAENVMTGCHVWTRSGFVATGFQSRRARNEEKAIRAVAMEQLNSLGLAERAGALPKQLSWGEQKLVGLARALVARPSLVLLDEPYGGLVQDEIDRLSCLLRELTSAGMTVLMVEHLTDVVMDVASRVVVLHYGEKIAEGPPRSIRHDERVIATYLGE
jgi:ABC-type branched-subunit amino acid transport system ATPase component